MLRTYTCRLYPTDAQAAALRARLDAANELYNATLRELYQAWVEPVAPASPIERGRSQDQCTIEATHLEDARRRAEQAFGALVLRRDGTHGRAAPPLRARQYYVSLTFAEWSRCDGGRLDLPGVGAVAVHRREALPVCSGAVTVKSRGNMWQACFGIRHPGRSTLEAAGRHAALTTR